MNWALRRQFFFIAGILLVIAVIVFSIIYPKLNKAPTCFDGKQNGTETGIDCGGSCALACVAQVEPVSILWARAFEVVPGRYNAVAYLVNHNQNVAAESVSYRFRFADANNIYIGKRDGTTVIPPSGNFAIFEPAVGVGNSVPVYTTFEFTETPQWFQVSQDKISQLKVLISNLQLSGETTNPKLSATIKNNSLFTIPNVNVVALLYDKSGNVVSASNTYVAQLNPLATNQINFTWPGPFSSDIVAKELIPMYDVFAAKLK